MGLKDVLKRLIGSTEAELIYADGFQQAPDSQGISFIVNLNDLELLNQGKGAPILKLQFIALKMLLEEGLASEIRNGFHLTSEVVVALDDDNAEILNLPPKYLGEFSAQIKGRTGLSSFAVQLIAKLGNENIPFKRKGPFIYLTSTECYRLSPPDLMGLSAVETHDLLTDDARGEAANIRLMAALQLAVRSGMKLSLNHFDKIDIVVPNDIGVTATRLPDGSLLLCPSLGHDLPESKLSNRWSQVQMSNDHGVMRVDNKVVLLEPNKMAAIREVFGNKHIPADKVADFLRSPSAFLDAALVNLEMGFAVRVLGVGKLQHMEFGELDAIKQDWFSNGQSLPTEAFIKLVNTDEDLDQVTSLINHGEHHGAATVTFDGKVIDISDQARTAEVIEKIKQRLLAPKDDEPEVFKEEKQQLSVVIADAKDVAKSLLAKASSSTVEPLTDWSELARQPFPHQKAGIDWMLGLMAGSLEEDRKDIHRLQGALLADDMGLGKTYMSLVAIHEFMNLQKRKSISQKPTLIVAPLSLLENWEDEVKKTFSSSPFRDVVVLQAGRDLSRFKIKGADRESTQIANTDLSQLDAPDQVIRYALHIGPEAGANRLDMDKRLVLTTYQTLRDYQFSMCMIDWGTVVFDEAQNIKNPNALQTRAAKGLKADFKLLATGTPVENSLLDFWCLLDTAQPGLLGDWRLFRERWIKPIINASPEARDEVRNKLGLELRQAVGGFMLRRVKEEQLTGLPKKWIYSGLSSPVSDTFRFDPALAKPMSHSQIAEYSQALEGFRHGMATENMRGQALAILSQLRTICLHPRLHQEKELLQGSTEQIKRVMFESGRFVFLIEILNSIKQKNEKVTLRKIKNGKQIKLIQ